jgi:integrase
MLKNMSKNSQNTSPVQRNTYTASLGKTPKLAGNARAPNIPAPAKRTGKRRSLRQPVCLSFDEKDRFFRAIKNPRDLALFRLAYHHALRASELGLLSLSDYRKGPSLDSDRIRITRKKGSVSGECFVIPQAARAVRVWLKRRGDVAGPLFLSRHHRAISRGRVFSLFRKYAAAAGLPSEKRFPHILKHSAVTHLLEMGEDIVDTQRHAGHSSIGSTMRYLHLGNPFDMARAQRLATWK